jgi:hypothetical protein
VRAKLGPGRPSGRYRVRRAQRHGVGGGRSRGLVVVLAPRRAHGRPVLRGGGAHVGEGNIFSHGLLNRPAEPKPYPPHASSHYHQLRPIVGGATAGGDRETLEAVIGEAAARSHFPHPPLPASTPWLPAEEARAGGRRRRHGVHKPGERRGRTKAGPRARRCPPAPAAAQKGSRPPTTPRRWTWRTIRDPRTRRTPATGDALAVVHR